MSARLTGWALVAVYAYGGILIIVHAPAYAVGGGIMMYAAGLIGGLLIASPTPDRSGEAGETTKIGSTEGESGLPEGSSKPCP